MSDDPGKPGDDEKHIYNHISVATRPSKLILSRRNPIKDCMNEAICFLHEHHHDYLSSRGASLREEGRPSAVAPQYTILN